MLAPISWIEEFVKIDLSLEELMWRLTEVGLTCESYQKVGNEKVLDLEVTPNRPDWLSILGVATEIAVIEERSVRKPHFPNIPTPKKVLPIKIGGNFKEFTKRYVGLTISGVSVKESPKFISERLLLMGARPINNLVDITNYVMYELGIPIHVFDYDKFERKELVMELSKGGESFVSVDGIAYTLPEGLIIIKDGKRVVDLCGVKGGLNSGVTANTKNIFIHVPVYTPSFIRRASQELKIKSEAAYIYERGADAGGALNTLKKVVELIRKYAGGEVSSQVLDIKIKDYLPKKLNLNFNNLEKTLGISIPEKSVIKILTNLGLSPQRIDKNLTCTIPSKRGDLKLEEDLIEEVARIYGYNKFPKTLPSGRIRTEKIPFFFDDSFHLKLKNILSAMGFFETINFSLISKEMIRKALLNENTHLKISNPVSKEYEYLRASIIPELIHSVKLNHETKEGPIQLFELGKVYTGSPDNTSEIYKIACVCYRVKFNQFKGFIDFILSKLNIKELTYKNIDQKSQGFWNKSMSQAIFSKKNFLGIYGRINQNVTSNFGIEGEIFAFEFDVSALERESEKIFFEPIPKYPPQIEDITFHLPSWIRYCDLVKKIKNSSSLIKKIDLKEIYQNTITLRIYYLHPDKTLENKEVEKIRESFLSKIRALGVKPKS